MKIRSYHSFSFITGM